MRKKIVATSILTVFALGMLLLPGLTGQAQAAALSEEGPVRRRRCVFVRLRPKLGHQRLAVQTNLDVDLAVFEESLTEGGPVGVL